MPDTPSELFSYSNSTLATAVKRELMITNRAAKLTEHVCLQRKPRKGLKRHLLAESESASHSARLFHADIFNV